MAFNFKHDTFPSIAHDVIAVRHMGTRGPYAKVYVDGMLTCSASFRNGALELRGEVWPDARAQVITTAEEVLGARR